MEYVEDLGEDKGKGGCLGKSDTRGQSPQWLRIRERNLGESRKDEVVAGVCTFKLERFC